MALLFLAIMTTPARADCSAAPIADPDDMAISFLAANGVQAASASLLASSIKEGTLVYDDSSDKLKICDGTDWIDVGTGSGADTLTSLSCNAGEIVKFNGTVWSCAADGGGGTPAGSVAGAVQFRGTTAIFAADDINLVWDNTNKRLGIGTASPGRKLDIKQGADTEDSAFAIINSGVTNAGKLWVSTANDFQLQSGPNANQLVLDSGGNVGIGTTSPGQALDVVGRVTIHPSGTGADNGYNGNLIITRPPASGQYINLTRSGNYPWSIGTVYNTSNFAIGTGKATDSSFIAPEFVLTTAGNVGIGTSSPTNPLSVDGTGQGSNDSSIVAYTSASNDAFSVLPSAGVTYLGSGVYYKDGAWVHDGFNTSNALFAFGGMGGLWFASNNSTGSWNLTGGTSITLWNSSGVLMGASSRSFKEGFTPLDKQSVLERISHLKIDEWKYRNEPGDIRHVGPVAEDWHATFGTGDSNQYIPLVDSVGISLVGIQALKQENDEFRALIEHLSEEIKSLKVANDNYEDLRRAVEALKAAR